MEDKVKEESQKTNDYITPHQEPTETQTK